MSDLKNQIFTLLKKCPKCVELWGDGCRITYKNGESSYVIHLSRPPKEDDEIPFLDTTPQEHYEFQMDIWLNSAGKHFATKVELTEKEYMEMKWTIEEWNNTFTTSILDEFKEFVETEPSSMDDLLND